jgi:NAD(P)-dependent dehydrogenase (short-subunit alcohol dehydrogenase family)
VLAGGKHLRMNPVLTPLVTGQTAIVTGGGGGIGRAIALALAGGGANVVIADIIPERCAEVAERVRELGGEALPFPTDVTDTDTIRAMIAAADAKFGRIDILVNNAGGVGKRAFAEQSERSWRKHVDLNLISLFVATQAVIEPMIRGGRGGIIINVSSIEAARAAPNFAVYAACKAGVNNFTRSMALELADHHIRVNAIAPDYTITPGTQGNHAGPVDEANWAQPSPAQADATERRIPQRRPGLAQECGQAALFLASPMASYINGVILPVDGGSWASSGWVRNRKGAWVLAELHEELNR